MAMITFDKLQAISQKTKVCKVELDGEQCEFIIKKMSAKLANKGENASPFELISDCLVEPKLNEEQISNLSIDIINAFNKEIGKFNGVDTDQLEKN